MASTIRSWLAPLICVAYAYAFIYTAAHLSHSDLFRCKPGDKATTNGRELCPEVRGAFTE